MCIGMYIYLFINFAKVHLIYSMVCKQVLLSMFLTNPFLGNPPAEHFPDPVDICC